MSLTRYWVHENNLNEELPYPFVARWNAVYTAEDVRAVLNDVVQIVEGYVKVRFSQWELGAVMAGDPHDQKTVEADLNKHDPLYLRAKELLTRLQELAP